ncbi:MAG TPA: hypothetical protein VGP77_08120 [Vicinamibacterales bacterium]|nr:hypothetical protein [Vicinamibacterales bacterium]
MKPDRSILDASFRYVPAVSTSVADTWRRFGWQPASLGERQLQPQRSSAPTSGLVAPRLARRSA